MNKKPSAVRKLVSLSITALFLAYLYFNWHPILRSLENIRPGFFVLVILGQILAQMANSSILCSSLKPLGVSLNYFEAFKVTVVSSFVNFFTPVVGGASARAVYLKSRHGLAYSSFAGALYANYVIMFLISFIFGFTGVLVIPHAIATNTGTALAFFLACGILGSGLFLLFGHQAIRLLHRIPFHNKLFRVFLNKLELVNAGWLSIKNDKHALTHLSFWSACQNVSLMLIYWSSTASLGLKTNVGSFMIFAALASISLLFNLTPGSIGVREGLYTSTYKITNINARQVIAFSFVDRAAQLVVLGAAWMLFGNSVLKDLEKNKTPATAPGE